MSGSSARLQAIVRADVLLRLRRTSTIVVFLMLSGFAYLWVPDLSTGRTLLQIDGQRVIYNSAALGMGTALVATLFLGLFAFYILSNTIRRDIASRCGFVIASTNVRSSEYIWAKFLGNVIFLSIIVCGFMLTSMVMQLIRGEAPLQPIVFAGQYLMLVPPTITFVSAVAILFESVKWLSGKFGDVMYFVLWLASLGVVGAAADRGDAWPRYVDFGGTSVVFTELEAQLGTNSFSIGASSFDGDKPPLVFAGLAIEPSWILSRVVATLLPLSLLFLAQLFFHRFDPSRIRSSQGGDGGRWRARLNSALKPLGRVAWSMSRPRAGRSLASSVIADGLMSLTIHPLTTVILFGITVASVIASDVKIVQGILMVAIAAAGIAVADIASRERTNGAEGLAFAAPRLRERFVLWKLGSSAMVSFLFVAAPVLRALQMGERNLALAATTGSLLVAALAVALAIVSGTPKTFMIVFLSFWYVALNDRGANAWIDFAGFNGTSTIEVAALWTVVTIVATIVAEVGHRRHLSQA